MIDDPVRFSHLRAYGRSAAHGRHARTSEWKPTAPMLLGTAVHALAFDTGKVIAYPKVRRGEAWEAFQADHPDCHILTETEYARAVPMAAALAASSVARPYLEGVREQTVLFDWYGRKCRATPDVYGTSFVTDLKSCQTSDPTKFTWSSLRFAYHAQMRLQMIACPEAEAAYVVAIESTEPFPVTVFRVTDEALIEGEKLLTLWMERLITCEASDSYPPYVECVVPLDVPRDVDLDYGDDDA